MDFFARQDQARRRTKWLVIYFILAVVSMIALIYGAGLVASFYAGSQMQKHHIDGASNLFAVWNPKLLIGVTIGTLVVIITGSLWKTMELSGGGSAVAESLGGRLVQNDTTDPDERKLINVVEEMSIASGVPMPQVYVLEYEDGINAFAAGHSTNDAAIAVTQNCMTKLTRDELQGVIGHEFSHILNGDMKLNLRLIGILFGIFCIATIGRILLQMRSGNSRDRNPLPILGILLLIIGSLGVLFGRLIQAAISRQREFLADASSVQFTRNPAGLSGALQKVGGYTSAVMSPHAPDAAHMFFGDVNGSQFFNAMATHPPLDERIRAIDPAWDGQFKRVPDERRDEVYSRETGQPQLRPQPHLFDHPLTGAIIAAGAAEATIRTRTVLPSLGNPTPLHLKYAEELRESMPEELRAAAREPLAATALIYALILAGDEKLRTDQLAEIARRISQDISTKTAEFFPTVSQIAQRTRLPLVNLALGALSNLEPRDFAKFVGTLDWLVGSDGQVELFEFVLQKIVRHHLGPKFGVTRPRAVQYYTLKPLVPDCAAILSALAHVGSADDAEVQKAFDAGAPYLRAPDDAPAELLPREQCGVDTVGTALDRLTLAAPIIKKNLIDACARVVGADGVILETEAELLRAVAETLDCPIPPLGVAE